MKNIFVFTLSSLLLLLLSCNDDTDFINKNVDNETENVSQKNEISILSFDSEDEFNSMVELMEKMEYTDGITRSMEVTDFKSLFDEFDEAMTVADEYYTRDGGYEEFKARFSNLYYPEYGEDYAAFLPVSNEIVARLLNKEGKVMINGEERDMRDVYSYEKLQELGLAMPDETEASTRVLLYPDAIDSSFPYNVILTTSKKTVNSKRKMWVTPRGIEKKVSPGIWLKDGRVDFCWRKKGKLGWYNGKLYGYPTFVIKNKTKFPLERKYEYSPMKFTVIREYAAFVNVFPDDTPLDMYVRFESDERYADFIAMYPANLKQLLLKNNGDGFWENFSGMLKTAVTKIGKFYGSRYIKENF